MEAENNMSVLKALVVIMAVASPREDGPISVDEALDYAKAFGAVVQGEHCNVPLEVLLAVASYENRLFIVDAVSPTNDVGLMQVHAKSKEEIQLFKDPRENISEGCRRLAMGRRGKTPRTKERFAAWFQRYNSGSVGYGERIYWAYARVRAVLRRTGLFSES